MSVSRSGPYRAAARRVLRWCNWYTRRLDPVLAGERQDEIASDLHEHGKWADAAGATPRVAAASILWRAARGVPADLSWRAAAVHGRLAQQDRIAVAPRLAANALLWLTAVVGVFTVALGLFVLVRVVRALLIGDIGYVPQASFVIAALLVGALSGLVLLASPRRRSLGALLLAIPAFGIPMLSADVLYYISATVTAIIARVALWTPLVTIIAISLALLCFATAVWAWRPTRTVSARTVSARTVSTRTASANAPERLSS